MNAVSSPTNQNSTTIARSRQLGFCFSIDTSCRSLAHAYRANRLNRTVSSEANVAARSSLEPAKARELLAAA